MLYDLHTRRHTFKKWLQNNNRIKPGKLITEKE
jgi:hypothetical protein